VGVRGRVAIDRAAQRPVSGATILLEKVMPLGTPLQRIAQVTTDRDGKFFVEALGQGRYFVTVRWNDLVGFEQFEVSGNEDMDLDTIWLVRLN
jgi:hypothetical protein